MALLANGFRLGGNPMRIMGAPSAGVIDRAQWNRAGANENFYAGEGTVVAGASVANRNATPSGYLNPGAWILPPKPGGMASRVFVAGAGELTNANLAGGLNAAAALSGSGTITNAAIQWIMQAAAALVGTGVVTAELSGSVGISANLTGSGSLVGALAGAIEASASLLGSGSITNAGLLGALSASANLTGSGALVGALAGAIEALANLTGSGALSGSLSGAGTLSASVSGSGALVAALQALGNLTAAIIGAGTITDAQPYATGDMSADITVAGDLLTTANVAQAVWTALVATFSGTIGSFAEAIANGSAGLTQQQIRDAMALSTSASVDPGSIDLFLTELWRMHGLEPGSPLVVTPTSRSTTGVSQTIGTAGTTVTVERT